MKQQTRDNLIYLAFGLGVGAFVFAEALYSVKHDTRMWMPSKFAVRAVYSTGLLAWALAKKMVKAKDKLVQILSASALACAIHVGIIFEFRRAINDLPAVSFSPVIVEMFLVGILSERTVLYLTSGKGA